MKYRALLFAALLYLSIPANGQPSVSQNRKLEIEECTKQVYSINEFRRVADSLQMSIDELSDYPVIFPIKNPQRISSGFGMRYHPIYRMRRFHPGIDIPGTKGTPVYVSGNGVVIRKGYDSGYGYYIEIKHAGGFRSFYAHLSRTLVNVGDSVRMGKYIACVGTSGITTGSHLHYDIRKGNRFLNPTLWCFCLFEILKSNNKQNN